MPDNVLWFDDVAMGRPFHAALVPVPAGGRGQVQPHRHGDFHELVLVVAGRGVHRVGGSQFPLQAGDLVLIRPSDEHEFSGIGTYGLRFINVAFPSERWRTFADLAGVTQAAAWDRRTTPPVATDPGLTLERQFSSAVTAHARGPRTLDVIRLWTAVVPYLERAEGAPDDLRPPWLVAACSAMANEEHLRIGLPRLLQLAAVSHAHLARSIVAHYGCTPSEFVTECRLARASLLLATTTDPIGTIAARCGFSSQSYFGRRFRERHGTAPRDYREQARRAVVPERVPNRGTQVTT